MYIHVTNVTRCYKANKFYYADTIYNNTVRRCYNNYHFTQYI